MSSSRSGVARVLPLVIVVALVAAIVGVVKNPSWLSPFGIGSESHDSQVISAMQRTQEVSLLSLSVQGLKDKKTSAEVLGKKVPGTEKTVFLKYDFKAKLGIDGAKVKITKKDENTYRIAVPEFIFVGYDRPSFHRVVEDGSLLSWAMPDVDQLAMVNEILSDKAKQDYIDSNEDMLKEQVRAFYDGLLTSVDPNLNAEYDFRSEGF
ncbi:hypothetical protein GCM10025782_12990 [Pedococcus ginsenosidimutans]|uniref:DUF4230 domain-containing protein n=1 Tax=Pedococcus ginsenosidimutans TaxID=490570 RepID=A0ABP8XYG9_9MICO